MLLAQGCGGPELVEEGIETASFEAAAPDSCTAARLEWPAGAADAQKVCEGPFEHPGACCDLGINSNTCKHAHAVQNYTATYSQAAVPTYVCTRWGWECGTQPLKVPLGAPLKAPLEPAASPDAPFTPDQPCCDCIRVCLAESVVYNYPACSATSPAAVSAVNAVNAARAGCALPAGAAGVSVVSVSPAGVASSSCTVTVSGAPVAANGTPNACDTAADQPMCGPFPATRTYGACGALPATNVDGSARTQVSSNTCPTLKAYSAPGLSLATLKASLPALQQTGLYTCLTGEDIVASSSGSASAAKFGTLDARRTSPPPVANVPALQTMLAQKQMELFESWGQAFTPAQAAVARGLYALYPPPGCGQAPDALFPPPNAPNCLPTAVADGKLRMCDRLRDQHVPVALAQGEAAGCVAAWADVSALGAACTTRATYAGAYQETSTELLRKAFSTMTEVGAARVPKLRERLALTQTWYGNLKLAGVARDQLFRESEIVGGAIFSGAYSNRIGQLDTLTLPGDPTQQALRDSLVSASAADDQEVLSALLTAGSPPLTSAPALWVVARALQPTSQRLGEIDFVHDLGCTFRGCAGLATEVSQMHGLLGNLTDAAALAASPTSLVTTGWQTAMSSLALSHAAVLQPAVRDAAGATSYSPALVEQAGAADGPLLALKAITQESKTKGASYASTGRFRPGDADALYTGLLFRKLDEVISLVDRNKSDLHAEHLAYDAGWVGYIDALSALIRSGDQLTNGQSELAIKATLLRQYLEQVDGLRVAGSIDEIQFGNFGKSYDEAVRALEASDNQQYVQRTASPVLSITPANARYSGTAFTSPIDVGVQVAGTTYKMSATSGDLVRIEATGVWSPTCAIEAYSSVRPAGFSGAILAIIAGNPMEPKLEGFNGAMTGTMGYGIVYQSSTYRGRGSTSADFNPASLLPGAGAAIGMAIGGPVGGAIGGLAGSLLGGLLGGNDKSGSSSGSESRASAVFNVGLRVPTAPYPAFPAGALLAVRVDPATGVSYDTHVVQQPSSTLVMDRATDVYLVVNDTTCTRAASVGALSVQLTRMTPLAGYARQVQTAMASTYTYVQDQIRNKLLPQKAVLPSDLGTIRSQALSNLALACNYCNLAAFDRNLMALYTAFVDTALNQAERQVEMSRLERQIRILTMEWEAMALQVQAAARQSQLLALLPAWSANNIDEARLRGKTEALVQTVERFLVPFARAKYPEVLTGAPSFTGLRSTPAVFQPITVGLSPTRDWGTIAEDLVTVVTAVENAFLSARVQFEQLTPPPENAPITETIGVAIPKPLAMWSPDMLPSTYTHRYRELASEEAERIWTSIRAGQTAEIHIPVEAIYRGASEPIYAGQLDCTRTIPVIQSMAIFAADDGNSANAAFNSEPGHNVQIYSSDSVTYGTSSGPVALLGVNPAWRNFSARILYGQEGFASDYYRTYPLGAPASKAGAGQGLSPFGRFTLGADVAQLDRPNVFAIILLMTVEYRNNSSAAPPTWIASCR